MLIKTAADTDSTSGLIAMRGRPEVLLVINFLRNKINLCCQKTRPHTADF